MEKTYEEHSSKDIKTKDKIESVRKSVKKCEKTAEAIMTAPSPMCISNALQSMGNPNPNGTENSMALVSTTHGLPVDDSISNVVSAVNEATKCEVMKKGKFQIIQQTKITTTTTTETKTTIVQQIIDQDENETPKKGKKSHLIFI